MQKKKRSLVDANLGLFRRRSRGQVWVETMIYTLIAFALIGLVLAFVRPKIQQIQDKSVIDQSISVLNDIDSVINSLGTSGNQRVLDVSINKGTLTVDGVNDKIYISVPSNSEYSQVGQDVPDGNVIVRTDQAGSAYNVLLTIDYSGLYNITFNGLDAAKELNQAPTAYKLLIANNGKDIYGKTLVNMEVVS